MIIDNSPGHKLTRLSELAVGLALHEVAFQPVLVGQASREQQAYWLPKVSY